MMSLFPRFTVPPFVLALLGLTLVGGSLPAQEFKVAVLDVQRILTESAAGQAVLEQLEQLRDEKANELQSLRERFDDAQKRFNEGRLTLSQEKLAEIEKELEELTVQLRRAQDDAQRALQERQREEFERIEVAVMPIINQVGNEFGYTLIFNKFQSGLVYADEAVDITDLVIQRYDAAASN